ncbi:MAG: nicotinate-nucleotide adenylyltransferase [Chlamydiae bacterium]|nr:nicotinate-nucleotide adenylyltransferase [Chlamydiota bacterium]
MKRKIGFFGGTFDPIHFGHLNLAIQILESCELDEIHFCPANFSPSKENKKPVAANSHRRAMTLLALSPIKAFSLIDLELNRSGPSFTIDTIREISRVHPQVEYRLILGENSLAHLSKWKEIEQLFALAPPLIGIWGKNIIMDDGLSREMKQIIMKEKIPISIMDISSTLVRERLKLRKYCGHLVPLKVLDYIYQHDLYA